MKIEFASINDEVRIKQLLAECGLPSEDVTPEHLRNFFILWEGKEIGGVVGLEILGRFALLRSLAVPVRYRRRGFASQLTSKAEGYAFSLKVNALCLLTTTAEKFFADRAYQRLDRNAAPAQIKETAEFQSLCPVSSICMVKYLKAT